MDFVNRGDIFYCTNDNFSHSKAPTIKGESYYVDTIYINADNNVIADFYLSTRDDKLRFKVLCDGGVPLDRFFEFFVSEKEWLRDIKINELVGDE